ncbi:biotin/lipoyl-binding protein, partial [Pseudomonas aeruginosa]
PVNGIVSELRIQEGQRVEQGDVLFVMADQRSQTGNRQTTKISDLRLASLAQRQESLKRLRTTTQQLGMTNEAGLRRQHDNINEELQRNQQELDLYARRVQALSKIVANHRELAEKKYISHLELQDKEDQLSSLETQLLGAQRSRSQLTRSSANLLSEIHQAPIKMAGQLAEIDRDL